MSEIDLTTCDTEPIHIPGAVQAHGFVLAVNEQFEIRYCSENIIEHIGITASSLLNRHLDDTEPGLDEANPRLSSLIRSATLGEQKKTHTVTQREISGKIFNLIISSHQSHHIIDFEPAAPALSAELQTRIGRSLSEMLSDHHIDKLLDNASRQIREIIGYDRVMIYKFHEDGHGEVVSEARHEGIESWVGLHYPASDIPKQARTLYAINQVRLIGDVHSEPSALITTGDEGKVVPLDLTYSTLRAVSPVHIQYLKNMGVASSFSISIMNGAELWGLVACHHYSPRIINYNERESAKLVGQVLSSAISFREQEDEQKNMSQHRQAVEHITRYLLRDLPVNKALFNGECALDEVISCSGAILYYDGKVTGRGNVPPDHFIEKLIDWIDHKIGDEGYYHNHTLDKDFPSARQYQGQFCGVMACRLGRDLREYMIWFRPEVLKQVKWAGKPDKDIERDDKGLIYISPRNSFREWSEQVSGTSDTWKNHEVMAVIGLRDEVNYAINRKAVELRVINEKLRLAYAELDTFSYTVSHDLKNPLSSIKAFSQLIQRATPENAARTGEMGAKIEKSVIRMQTLIEEVLDYARVGHSRIDGKAVDMQKLLEEIRQDLMISSGNPDLIIEIKGTPEVYGDHTMIYQVFSNIIGNAVKYSGKSIPPIVMIEGAIFQNEVVYSISDNGIGINQGDFDKVFELFSRAGNTEDIKGTGVGLAIAKRILDKHGATIELESVPGKGSTFHMHFQRFDLLEGLN